MIAAIKKMAMSKPQKVEHEFKGARYDSDVDSFHASTLGGSDTRCVSKIQCYCETMAPSERERWRRGALTGNKVVRRT